MSVHPSAPPDSTPHPSAAIDLVLRAHPRDLGGFSVRRALPAVARRSIGPFVFVDHMGPTTFAPGHGIDVRPHPHISLATITYLFEGSILHRDTIGSVQRIVPGDVNWMLAGSGIAHSERTPPDVRERGGPIHGLQTWVALPKKDEETAPRFEHHPASTIPKVERDGVSIRVIAGTAYGVTSPVGVLSPTLYAHAVIERGAELALDDAHAERAVYVVDGEISCKGAAFDGGSMPVFHAGARAAFHASSRANVVLLGGAPLDGPRYLFWNFVSSSKERLERAKDDWRNDRFGVVTGDEHERIPLPEG